MSGLFENLAAERVEERKADRHSVLAAEARAEAKFGSFLKGAQTREEAQQRFALVEEDFRLTVSEAVAEYGGDFEKVYATIKKAYQPTAGYGHWDTEPNDVSDEDFHRQHEGPEPIDAECPTCGGPGVHLGTLGTRDHYRCRNCGIDFNHSQDDYGEAGLVASVKESEKGENPFAKKDDDDSDDKKENPFAKKDDKKDKDDGNDKNPFAKKDKSEDDEGDEDKDGDENPFAKKDAALRFQARKPKLCPYHSEVVDISLSAGDPAAGFNAMSAHAWGDNHCKGGHEGRCNFKREMVTQSYWDKKAEDADTRRQEREQQRLEEPAIAEPTFDETPELDNLDSTDVIEEVIEPDGGLEADLAEAPSAVGVGVEAKTAFKDPDTQDRDPNCPNCGTNSWEENPAPCPSCQAKYPEYSQVNTLQPLNRGAKTASSPLGGRQSSDEDDRDLGDGRVDESPDCDKCGVRTKVDLHGNVVCPSCGSHFGKTAADDGLGGKGTPSPKIDKSKWTPKNVKKIDSDKSDGPNPSEDQDIIGDDIPKYGDPTNIGEQVTESVELDTADDLSSGFGQGGETGKGQGGTFPKGNQANPVTKAAADDPEKNPIREMILNDYDGFAPELEVQQALATYRK